MRKYGNWKCRSKRGKIDGIFVPFLKIGGKQKILSEIESPLHRTLQYIPMGRVKYEENLGDDIMRVSANPIPYSKINVTAKSGLCWLQTFYASNLYIIKLLLLFVLCFNTKGI